jgi:hypothetical protein
MQRWLGLASRRIASNPVPHLASEIQVQPFLANFALAGLLGACLDVLIVQHSGPSGTFTDIQSACNQAHERDTILVKPGTYPSFEVVDKWLTVVADTGPSVFVNGGIQVRDLQVGKRVTLIGLFSSGAHTGNPGFQNGLRLMSDQGAVRVTNCQFLGAQGVNWEDTGKDGIYVDQSADASLSHCTSVGGLAALGYTAPAGGAGLHLIQSSAAVYDCTLQGSRGVDTQPPPYSFDAEPGGNGCSAESSQLFASHTTFQGGDGGDAGLLIWGGTSGGAGGNGLVLSGTNAIARLVSPTAIGGMGGYDGTGPVYAYPGQPFVGGPIITLPVTFRSMTLALDPIRENTTADVTVWGLPGDRVGLIVTTFDASAFNPTWNGVQLFPTGSSFLRFGTLPAHGMLTRHLPFGDLGPSVQSRTYQLQALFSGVDGVRVLGTPNSLVVLDSAY